MLLALLAACTPVSIAPDLEACTDVDFDNPQPSELVAEADGDVVRVTRTYAFVEGTGLTWQPTIATEGKVIHVYEDWTGGDSDDAFCYEPAVVLSDVKGTVQVRWYLSTEDSVPWDTIEVEGG